MDTNYPFRQQNQWLETTEDLPCRMQVISGHYHTEATVMRGNTTVLITPSTYIQLDPHTPKLKLVNSGTYLREIEVTPNGLSSRVVNVSPLR